MRCNGRILDQRIDFKKAPVCRKESVVQGAKYRISILTPALLRLEYSEEGVFEDRATQVVLNRDFPLVRYRVWKSESHLYIETDELKLAYDQKKFSAEGLKITVKSMGEAVWHYGQELHDLKGTYRTLDGFDGAVKFKTGEPIELGHGVLSREGFSVIDDSKSMALTEENWVEPKTENLDIYFFGYGHRYLECLNDFYHLCGSTPLLPRYVFGNWWSRYYPYTEQTYKALMTRFEEEKLPFTVAVIDMDWHLVKDVDPKYGTGWTGYTWNRKFFPQPEHFLEWLHQKGMKVTLNVHPADGIRAYEEIYPKVAEAMGIDPASENPVAFDAADPHFMDVYFRVLSHGLEQQGVDFWWIDWQQGENSKVSGLDPLWILNHYHYLDSAWKGTRPLTFSRYAGVGSHRYPVGFSGDTIISWDSLDFQPYFTNTASNIGYGWWSHDIGGHMAGTRDDELMARWIQYGVFSPIHRLHSSDNLFSGKEPWRYDAATRQVMNQYLRLRHGMIPYLYTMNKRAHQENQPLIQPMYYQEPEQEEAYQVPNQYYFGTELIVAPITQPSDRVSRAAKVQAWLPEGLWADFFNGMVYQGGRMVDLWRDIENIPVLMKAGAIIPCRNLELCDNSVDNPKDMEIRIFPAADGRFTLWEDEGDTMEDSLENWASTELSLTVGKTGKFVISKAKGNLSVLPEKRCWKLVFVATKACKPEVVVNGAKLEREVICKATANSLILEIPDIDITDEICVSFEEGIQLMPKAVEDRCFEILERAQMSYRLKGDIYKIIKNHPNEAKELLERVELDENVRGCLMEILS